VNSLVGPVNRRISGCTEFLLRFFEKLRLAVAAEATGLGGPSRHSNRIKNNPYRCNYLAGVDVSSARFHENQDRGLRDSGVGLCGGSSNLYTRADPHEHSAFDPTTGNFLGQLQDGSGKTIINPGLWALVFRSDGVRNPNTLYFTAGSSGEDHGPVRGNFSSELSPSRKRMSAPSLSFQFALETR
jgi:hypothetical protein